MFGCHEHILDLKRRCLKRRTSLHKLAAPLNQTWSVSGFQPTVLMMTHLCLCSLALPCSLSSVPLRLVSICSLVRRLPHHTFVSCLRSCLATRDAQHCVVTHVTNGVAACKWPRLALTKPETRKGASNRHQPRGCIDCTKCRQWEFLHDPGHPQP